MAEAPDLYPYNEGDARTGTHARTCDLGCQSHLSDRCWCHGITTKPDGSLRVDAIREDGTDG